MVQCAKSSPSFANHCSFVRSCGDISAHTALASTASQRPLLLVRDRSCIPASLCIARSHHCDARTITPRCSAVLHCNSSRRAEACKAARSHRNDTQSNPQRIHHQTHLRATHQAAHGTQQQELQARRARQPHASTRGAIDCNRCGTSDRDSSLEP